MAQLLYWPNLRMKLGFSRTASLQKRPKPEKKKQPKHSQGGWVGFGALGRGEGLEAYRGLWPVSTSQAS